MSDPAIISQTIESEIAEGEIAEDETAEAEETIAEEEVAEAAEDEIAETTEAEETIAADEVVEAAEEEIAEAEEAEFEMVDETEVMDAMLYGANRAAAQAISLNTDIAGQNIAKDGEGWYKFTTTADGYVTPVIKAATLPDTNVCWRLSLRDASDNQITYWDFVGTQVKPAGLNGYNEGLPKGTYYLRMQAWSQGGGKAFTLRMNFQAAANWETEPNDKWEQRDTIQTGTQYTGSLAPSELDIYEFTIPADGYVTVDFSHDLDTVSGSWEIAIGEHRTTDGSSCINDYYSSYPGGSDRIPAANTTTAFTTHKIGLTGGKSYYLQISGNYLTPSDQSSANYRFKVNYTKASDWEKERNITLQEANPISLGSTRKGSFFSIIDYDTFWFIPDRNMTVAVTFNHVNPVAGSQPEIAIYDGTTAPNTNLFTDRQFLPTGQASFTTASVSLTKDHLYYVRLMAGGSASKADYSFKVAEASASSGGQSAAASTGAWKEDSTGWWYQESNGSYPRNTWKQIDGVWYRFDASGYMQTGWVNDGGKWYYLHGSGAMATGWTKVGSTWYYMDGSGRMQTGWVSDGGKWYYMDGSGAMRTGWVDAGAWYYMDGSGAMQTGWVYDGAWYYMSGSGAMVTGWVDVGGTWYYMDGSGAMRTGWIRDGAWYYLDGSGAMIANTSRNINGKTYHFNGSGVCTNP